MDRKRLLHVLVLVNLLIFIFLTAAVPSPNSAGFASVHEKSDLVALKVENKSSSTAYLWLDGPAFYYLAVKPDESKTITVLRGEYDEDVSYCGVRESTTIDLTKHTRLILPVCGANALKSPSSPNVINITNTIKIVKVTVKNDTDSRVLAILTGPSTYVFLLNKDEEQDYTIAKGDYDVRYYACGKVGVREFSAFYNSLLKFRCPK
jgi:hypothetical protein